MVKIRLSRGKRKGEPFYRIVVVNATSAVRGAAIAYLGYWNPRENSKQIDKKGVEEWIKKGAQISPSVQKLM